MSTESPPRKRQRNDDNNETIIQSESTTTTTTTATTTATTAVDEKLYSRQLYVMGHEAQRRMMKSHVLVVGLSGLGCEIAKNCCLAGVSTMTLVDPSPTNSFDLGSNFYLSEANNMDSTSRAELCREKLAELNRYVDVRVKQVSLGDATEIKKMIPNLSCLVITVPLSRPSLVELNETCRACKCVFIYTLTCSVFGEVFCDFGPKFTVFDTDGENPATSQIESIVCSCPAAVKVLEDQGRHGMETGDYVTFSRVKGVDGKLNTPGTEYQITVTGPYTFELDGVDFSMCEHPATQGYITQVKKPVEISCRSYADCMLDHKDEEFMLTDFAKMDRPKLLHLGFNALHSFREKNQRSPEPGNKEDIDKMLEIAKKMDKDGILTDDNGSKTRILKHLASGSKSTLSPMCAALGGIVGQEVLKACTGKFTPIKGFLYLDADECLPDDILPQDEVTPTGTSRYDSQIAVFGKEAQKKIESLNYFLVGAGAIGCEMLKNWALMGVGCGENGKIHITDMDRIEKSNLSRQFLFRDSDIGKFKSSAGKAAAVQMNKDMKIEEYQEKVCPETENIFGDDFYDNLDGVCTALDNVDARLYMDQRCLFYTLPMLESGTLGTKGNTQIVVPHVTENYGATRDPPEKSIPVCTLKNFPSLIQHTLQWARDYFEGTFKQSAEDVNSYLTKSDTFVEELKSQQNTKVETVSAIRKTLVDERPMSFDDCIVWARLKFEELFNNQIKQLLYNFPEDQVTSTGAKFWSGSKRCPKPLLFKIGHVCQDARMENHFNFIVAAANLRAKMYGIEGNTDKDYIKKVLTNVMVPDFSPKEGVKIAANDEEAKAQANGGAGVNNVDSEFDEILSTLPKTSEMGDYKLSPIEFDKDIDEHMLFVTACSNLRAINYGIPTEDTHRSRAIAGKIIPAIATTTAMVTGLICLELYKLVGTAKKQLKIDAYKNGFANLAIPFMTLSEPTAPATTKSMLKGKEWNWTAWDCLLMDTGDVTLKEFFQYFETKYNLEISMLSHGVSILYSFFANKKKVAERMKMPMSKIIKSITKKDFPTNKLFLTLEVIANDKETDEEVELPFIKFRFRP
eukprot:CAMPEP_0178953398 /NCGR_PEP_ID=MMETSP0789-20121207/8395_1 /TAXON_ID=3005 /ORGANISM="Rhizosolenia setigera, Strain CCMP 1694" /LENGTH=1077 /DNA_ID=CAMNT_0020634649 /DNA_START=182 /DNA_END=3415 /DNA_ORIENTATION=+